MRLAVRDAVPAHHRPDRSSEIEACQQLDRGLARLIGDDRELQSQCVQLRESLGHSGIGARLHFLVSIDPPVMKGEPVKQRFGVDGRRARAEPRHGAPDQRRQTSSYEHADHGGGELGQPLLGERAVQGDADVGGGIEQRAIEVEQHRAHGPHAGAGRGERIHRDRAPCTRERARSHTASRVRPSAAATCAAGADSPKRSMPSTSPSKPV